MAQSEQHAIYRLVVGGGRGGGWEAQANMEETDGERRQLTLKKGAPGDQV